LPDGQGAAASLWVRWLAELPCGCDIAGGLSPKSLNRLCQIVDHYWLNMSIEHRATLKIHVRENDHPIALRQWNLLVSASGFCPARTVLKTPDRLYQLVAHSLAN